MARLRVRSVALIDRRTADDDPFRTTSSTASPRNINEVHGITRKPAGTIEWEQGLPRRCRDDGPSWTRRLAPAD
jgi:hypothetical protein